MLAGSSPIGGEKLRFSWEDARGLSCRATITPRQDGAFRVSVPSGAGQLSRQELGTSGPNLVWQRLRDAEVSAGGTLQVDVR